MGLTITLNLYSLLCSFLYYSSGTWPFESTTFVTNVPKVCIQFHRLSCWHAATPPRKCQDWSMNDAILGTMHSNERLGHDGAVNQAGCLMMTASASFPVNSRDCCCCCWWWWWWWCGTDARWKSLITAAAPASWAARDARAVSIMYPDGKVVDFNDCFTTALQITSV